jgi:hypothetical protein
VASERDELTLSNSDSRIAIDLPCIRCGYNLRTLRADGACPECGESIGRSTSGEFLRLAPPDWVHALAAGTLIVTLVLGGVIGIAVTALFERFLSTPSPLALFLSCGSVLALAAPILLIMGTVGMTIPDPSAEGRPEGLTARRLARWCAAGFGVALTLLFTLAPVSPEVVLIPGLVLCVASLALLPPALLRHLHNLLQRVPSPNLARISAWLIWPVLGVEFVAALAVLAESPFASQRLRGGSEVVDSVLLFGFTATGLACVALMVAAQRALFGAARQARRLQEWPRQTVSR